MKQIEIIKPDDWHIHFRDGEILKVVVPETSKHFARGIIMPNLTPPIINGDQAKKYKSRIIEAIPKNHEFTPLMTLYLTELTNIDEIKNSFSNGLIFAAKLYPAGATTNSELGVKNLDKIMPLLETMAKIGMPLLIHGEVTDHKIDIFDREKVFIDKVLKFIVQNLPELRITLEHITTKEAVSFVNESNENLAASITPHHLALNRNVMLVGGIKPHYYCLPILKREKHRLALIEAATKKNRKFFLGTDTAPHLTTDKESACGCAGVFNSTYALHTIAEIFDKENALDNLENFTSINGALHYKLKKNTKKLILKKVNRSISLKKHFKVTDKKITVFDPKFPLFWNVIA